MLRSHREIISKVQKHFRVLVKYSSPDCRNWATAARNYSIADNRSRVQNGPETHKIDKVARDKLRKEEGPFLDWLYLDNYVQASHGHGFVNENGFYSEIWTQSPLIKHLQLTRAKQLRTDGCSFELRNHEDLPLLKAYRFDTNIRLNQCVRRCSGHGSRPHAQICGLTSSKTAVYTKQMVNRLVADIGTYASKFFTFSTVDDATDQRRTTTPRHFTFSVGSQPKQTV